MITCVIPSYRASGTILDVVAGVLPHVQHVIIVDDACPEGSGAIVIANFGSDPRVEVLVHDENRGVGAAMKTGIARSLELGSTVVVKVDADGQMDPQYIREMTLILGANPHVALVKGNRFGGSSITRSMPRARLVGNSLLTLAVRFTTGYWNGIDPTNGYLAIRASTLRRIPFRRLADRFFFEISLLAALSLRRHEIAEIEMPARYGVESSNLSIAGTLVSFPARLIGSFCRRILWQYLVADMNVGSLMLVFGFGAVGIGSLLAAFLWAQSMITGIPRTPATAVLVITPSLIGFQLLLNALLYDVQAATRVHKYFAVEDNAVVVGGPLEIMEQSLSTTRSLVSSGGGSK